MDNKTLTTIRQLEDSLWRSETRSSVEYMRKTLATDCFEFGQSGRSYTFDDLLEETGPTDMNAVLPLQNFQARRLAQDVILVTYVSKTTSQGRTRKANRSSIWSVQDGHWRLRFHQGTPVSD